MNRYSVFTKLQSLLGYISFFVWLFFLFIYIPNSIKYDFIEHKDEFYLIMTFVQIFMFYILQIVLTVIFTCLGIKDKKYVINSKYKIARIFIFIGLLINFIPIILFTIFVIYLLFFYK